MWSLLIFSGHVLQLTSYSTKLLLFLQSPHAPSQFQACVHTLHTAQNRLWPHSFPGTILVRSFILSLDITSSKKLPLTLVSLLPQGDLKFSSTVLAQYLRKKTTVTELPTLNCNHLNSRSERGDEILVKVIDKCLTQHLPYRRHSKHVCWINAEWILKTYFNKFLTVKIASDQNLQK